MPLHRVDLESGVASFEDERAWIAGEREPLAIAASGGALRPDLGRPGLAIELKAADAARFAQ